MTYRPAGEESAWPQAWRDRLAGQTLRTGEAESALSLHAWKLPDAPPGALRATLLEEMAWALWAHDVDAVICPLHVSVNPNEPPHILRPSKAAMQAVTTSGGIALTRADHPGAPAASVARPSPKAGAEQAAHRTLLYSRALVEPRETFAVRKPWKERLAARLDAWGRAWDQRFTSPAAVRTIDTLRQLIRQALMARQALASRRREDLFIATRKTWNPRTPAPDIAVNRPPHDGRTRVLMAMHWLELGGAEKGALDLIAHLPRDRYAIYVTTDIPSHNSWADRIRDRVEEIVHLPAFLPRDRAPVFFEHYLRTRRIDLLHIHHSGWAYESLPHIRRFDRNLVVVDTLHILEMPPSSGGYPELSCSTFEPFIDAHHVTSRNLERFCRERWRVQDGKLHCIYTNVDTRAYDPDAVERGAFRRDWKIPDGARLVVFLGRFVQQKRPERFVRMAAECRERWRAEDKDADGLRFAMVGRGPRERSLHRLAASLGLGESLVFTGESNDTRQVYRDADVVVLPSENEGLAFVTFEAMAMATPIICTDVAAQGELVPPEFLVPPSGNVARALADAVYPLLANHEQAEEAGRRAREAILTHHCIEQTREAVMRMYEMLA